MTSVSWPADSHQRLYDVWRRSPDKFDDMLYVCHIMANSAAFDKSNTCTRCFILQASNFTVKVIQALGKIRGALLSKGLSRQVIPVVTC